MAGRSPRGDVRCGLTTPAAACRSGPRGHEHGPARLGSRRPGRLPRLRHAPDRPHRGRGVLAARAEGVPLGRAAPRPRGWTSRCGATRSRASSGATTRPSPSTTTPTGWSPGAARPARYAAGRRTGGRADRGRGRRRARDLVQPGRRRLAGVRQAVRAVHPAGRGERGPPGVRVAVPRAGRGVRPVRRPRRRARVGAARRVLRVHLADRAGRARRRRDAGADVQLVVHGRDRDPAGRDSDTTAADNHAAVDRGRAGRRGHLADGGEQERAAAQQVPGADQGRAAGRGVDRLENITQGGGVRAPQRRAPDRRPGGGAALPRLLGPARRPDRHDGGTAAWTEATNPVDLAARGQSPRSSRRGRPPARCWTGTPTRSTAGPRARTSPAPSA